MLYHILSAPVYCTCKERLHLEGALLVIPHPTETSLTLGIPQEVTKLSEMSRCIAGPTLSMRLGHRIP